MKSLMLVLLLASITLTGCVMFEEQTNVTENVTPPPPPPPAPTPSFSITSPLSGELVMVETAPGDVNLVMSTSNLILRAKGGTKKTGEGHFQITLDNGVPDTSSSKIYVMSGVEEGSHTVEVELLNNDGTPYSPRITRSVTFTVEQEAPEVYVPQEYTVKIKDFTYEPAELTVNVSDKVTFVNEGNFPRSATCFINGKEVFDTDILASGKSATITMEKPFVCEYYATTHRAMTGKITVNALEN
jgi:plastocyanin